MRRAGHVVGIRKKRNTFRLLVGKPEGKRPLRRPRRRWEDNIKMDLVVDIYMMARCELNCSCSE
jgi:hypothetical protein